MVNNMIRLTSENSMRHALLITIEAFPMRFIARNELDKIEYEMLSDGVKTL